MKTKELEKLFNDFGIEVFRTKQDGEECAELNTYTAGGVNMIVWLNPFTVEEFRAWVDDFDVDSEIDIHRQDKRYRDAFSLTNSVEDFTEYINRMKQICGNLEDYQAGKKVYTVKTKFVFAGEFRIKAESKEQAKEYVAKHCGLCLGGDIHSTLPSDDVDWEFSVHPEKIIGHGKA